MALPRPDSDELANFDNQDAELGSYATQQAEPNEPAQAGKEPQKPVDNPPNGEAVSHVRNPQGWNIDVFWCVDKTPAGTINANEKLALTLFLAVADKHLTGDVRTVRLRRLPEVVNQMPVFNIKPGAITLRSTLDKADEAKELQASLQELLDKQGEDIKFRPERANNTIPKYLPVYVCMAP